MNIITLPLDHWPGNKPEYKYDERDESIRYIVLHATIGTDSRDWLSKWNRTNPNSNQNDVSIHYLIQRDGLIYHIIDEEKRAWHVGLSKMPDGTRDGNSSSIGIELEHMNEPDYPDTQMQATAELIHDITSRRHIEGKSVVSHASVAVFSNGKFGRKTDPAKFDWAGLWDRITKLQTSQEPFSAPKAVLPYSHLSYTLATPQIDAGKLTEYLVQHHSYKQYTQADVRLILNYYVKYGTQIGVDYVFAIAQMIHETGWLESWWSARPRRNPAGIGVSGQISTTDPKDLVHWAKSGNIWKKGQSFSSWDISVQHHLARLLLYARKDEGLTPEQLAFSQICPDRARLDRIRGVANQWAGFNGVWAVPGRTYAQKLAIIANSFITASQ